MARRASAELAMSMPIRSRLILRYTLAVLLLILAAFTCLIISSKIEQFVITDTRFSLQGPPEPGQRNEYFHIEGAHHASEEQITRVFARDFGRSVYLCPISERRARLLAVDWIREASVSRVWPNRLVIRVTERSPVAFVQIAAIDGSLRPGLIDAEGVLLHPHAAINVKFPVLIGVSARDTPEVRKERVRRMLRLADEIGKAHMEKIDEIDVSDLENVKVSQQFGRRSLVLMLGNQKFRDRFENFLTYYDEIAKKLPYARVLDLRVKDRIVAAGGVDDGK